MLPLTIFLILAAVALAQDSGPKPELPAVHSSIVITATPVEPSIDRRNEEVFKQTLFSRDDQVFHQLNAGINAGQHEGGGKSIEVRRFGFNLDHGGVSGGLKVLVDNVQQNQTTQGHGQGYLGSLKSLSPELIEEASIVNGPFSAEYGDFSGLGVVHIRQRQALPDQWTARMQGGSFNSQRGFLSFSPDIRNVDSFIAYEGSHTDGPFVKPLDYRRDNVTGNFTRRLGERRAYGLRMSGARNDYNSSGQIPLDLVSSGTLSPFGFLDPGEGGRIRQATMAGYYRHEQTNGAVWKLDGFVGRSLFDLYSNFTFFLNDPENGDAIQQHDSRLQQGANGQYLRPHRVGSSFSTFTAGGNFHDNQINVALYPRIGRTPLGVTTRSNARVTNGAGYAQESLALLHGKLMLTAGLRFDSFHMNVRDRVEPANSANRTSGLWQPKAGAAYTPFTHVPLTFHANYGRGISSLDARSLLTNRTSPLAATTDFIQTGVSSRMGRVGLSADTFFIDRSNELVYVADDGTLEFLGPSRAYGWEGKASVEITKHLLFSGGFTKVANAFYKGTAPREYVDRAPRFVANAGLTLANWRNWSGSLRMRAINRYILNGDEEQLFATGHVVYDFSMVRRINRSVDFNFSIENLGNRFYYETQNLIQSRPFPDGDAITGIHGTPGYPRTFTVGLTFRFRGK